ncbi:MULTISPECIES: sodium:solute symporter [Chryseobacterium]|uniref:Na+/proline symporter n=1 Tax=Chryseobacterium camelliae TaxID=1265445 RepID=A0ABU0TKK2_9FLAO|nr:MULTISPECIES: sodium:solute symporter [Chryseobacterium]MDT3408836.1 Na+/proline symporter [Pseudacidovorax intermedius]MDQ1097306.1 Na+/proline symporter [Chryseobacterium camelliae]MDQ1101239.1 Na+/proline symporter [Chryseobacterium sp. SORGH_AS_1048]MDR6084685.1 Na+/proline symporter [Chryseobacterium sp. SORGH_AS_0909]MDR6132957.1 Na+/proline symporter [Chryseobacterium sp. SORGH_AS_1175]
MNPGTTLLLFVFIYFIGLLVISYFTSRNSDNQSFFIGNKKSKWWLVAFGMIGTSLSGVTFISVPGTVGKITGTEYIFGGFEYYMMVIGFFIGYFIVAAILLPLYYKMNLTSIYTYLGRRFNVEAHKIGSIFFIISRAIGATARLYLVVNVLQIFLLEGLGVPFWVTAMVLLLMVLLYTFEGGVKTIVITDTLQTSFMIISLVACIVYILSNLNLSFGEAYTILEQKNYTHFINSDPNSKTFFLKTILGGIFITIAMTGLDQEMMQKNISVDNLHNSKKNMLTFAGTLLVVNLAFLFLGGLLYLFALQNGADYSKVPTLVEGKQVFSDVFGFRDASGNVKNIMGDDLFPALSLQGYFPMALSVIFIIGLISALFPSADGALTAVTSSYCVDLLNLNEDKTKTEKEKKHLRMKVHLTFTVVFFILIMVFKAMNDKSIVYLIMEIAGYTYGPLLGLFAFGIFTRFQISRKYAILAVTIAAPIVTYLINTTVTAYTDYRIGVELIILNGLLTFIGLWMVKSRSYLRVVD